MTNAARTRKYGLLAILLTLTTGLMGGCVIVSWVVANFVPKPKVSAQYEFGPVRKLLVFPDAQAYHLTYPPIKDLLADKLNRKLVEKELVADTVPYSLLQVHQQHLDRRSRETTGRPAALNTIASALGADRILYIDIRQFRLRNSPQEPIWSGHFDVRVRVVDNHGDTLWPKLPAEGYAVSVETPHATSDSATYSDKLTEDLAEMMAAKIVRLFYEHREGS